MGDAVLPDRSQLLGFRQGLDGDTPLGVSEFVGVLLVPTYCRSQGSLAT